MEEHQAVDQQNSTPGKTPHQSVVERIDKNKEDLIEQLKKTPIVQIACEKLGVGRATYYRWRKEDTIFAAAADLALDEGSSKVNDLAESQIISLIRDRNLGATTFWLRHHHPLYADKVEIISGSKPVEDILTPEQEELVKQALKFASLLPESEPQTEQSAQPPLDQPQLSVALSTTPVPIPSSPTQVPTEKLSEEVVNGQS